MTELDNNTLCYSYLPSAAQFFDVLNGWWILFVVIAGLSCFVLYGLFIEQILFVIENAHHNFRRYIIWITSVYPFMTLLTVIGFCVPRAGAVCNAAKTLYMMIAISNFVDLTVLMYGSEDVMVWALRDSVLHFNHQPFFCCLPCLPTAPVTKVKLRMVLAGCYQLPFSQAFYSLMVMILASENQIAIGSLNPTEPYIWLNAYILFMSLFGIYCLNIVSEISMPHLKEYNYNHKSLALKILIFTITVQGTIFDILAYYGAFPCNPPISHYVYKETIEHAFCIVEMAVFGLFSYHLYHKVEFREPNPTSVPGQARRLLTWERANIPEPTARYYNYGLAYPSDFVDDLIDMGETSSNNSFRGGYDFSGATLVIETPEPSTSNTTEEDIRQKSSLYQTLKKQFGYGRM